MVDWSSPDTYRMLVEQIQEAVIVVDRAGVIRLWNQGSETVFGYTAAEMLGGGLEPIIPEHLWKPHDLGFRRAVDSGHTKYAGRVMTTRAVHKDGSKRYVDMSFVLLRDAGGGVVGVSAVARDCTERQLAKQAAAGAAKG